jgi:hypothetical protein
MIGLSSTVTVSALLVPAGVVTRIVRVDGGTLITPKTSISPELNTRILESTPPPPLSENVVAPLTKCEPLNFSHPLPPCGP